MYHVYKKRNTGALSTPVKKPTFKYATRNSPNSSLVKTPGMKLIGEGLYGKVYAGYVNNGTRRAIKKTNANISTECKLQQRAYKIVPHHIVRIFNCSPKEMITEYFRGGTLKSFLVKHKATLTDDDLRNFILQIVCTLKLIHAKLPSFRHHDVHLENILVDDTLPAGVEHIDSFIIPSNGIRLAISDFGLSTNTNSPNNNSLKNSHGISKASNQSYDVHFFLAALNDIIAKIPNAIITKLFLTNILKGYAKRTNTHTREFRLIFGRKFMTYDQILADPYFNAYRSKKPEKMRYVNFGKSSPPKNVTVTVKRLSPTGRWTSKNRNLRMNLELMYKNKGVSSANAWTKATRLVNRVVSRKPLLKRIIKKRFPAKPKTPHVPIVRRLKVNLNTRPRNIENHLKTRVGSANAKRATKAIVNHIVAQRTGISSPGVDEAWTKVRNILGTSFGNVNIVAPSSARSGGGVRDVRIITESKLDEMKKLGYFIVDAREKSTSSYRALNPYYPVGFTFKGYHAKSLMGLWNSIKYITGKGTNKTRLAKNTGVRRVGKVEYFLFNGKRLTESEALSTVFIPAYKLILDTKFKHVFVALKKHPKIALLCDNKTAASILKEYLSE